MDGAEGVNLIGWVHRLGPRHIKRRVRIAADIYSPNMTEPSNDSALQLGCAALNILCNEYLHSYASRRIPDCTNARE